jgi:hypothetical protein
MCFAKPATYAEKRKEWKKALCGKDVHSIKNQLEVMCWNTAVFRIINKARSFAPTDLHGRRKLNGLMHHLINYNFFDSQRLAIRRLADTYSLEGEKGVYSLTGLLKDMKKHHNLFARKAIFEAEDLEYDYELVRIKYKEFILEPIGECCDPPSESCWEDLEDRHAKIDSLAGVSGKSRSPSDTINCKVFKNLLGKIEKAAEDVSEYVNKFLAHAASPESREKMNASNIGTTLADLLKAQQVYCEVAGFIAIVILGAESWSGSLPQVINGYDNKFQYLECPLIEESDKEKLANEWVTFDTKYHDWNQWMLDEYKQEFCGS